MKKQLVIFGIIVLLICVGLSGCNETTHKNNENVIVEKNIGDSIIIGNIKYTFLSAYWEKPSDTYIYNLEIKCENIGNTAGSGYINIKEYEMQNGYKYNQYWMFDTYPISINPGRNETITMESYEMSSFGLGIDREFLPVAKIYLVISEDPSLTEVTSILLNV
jgi:hypothetical protein